MENGPSTASLAHFSYLFVGLHHDQRLFKALFGGLGYVALGNHHEVRGQLSLAVHLGPVAAEDRASVRPTEAAHVLWPRAHVHLQAKSEVRLISQIPVTKWLKLMVHFLSF